MEHRKLAVIGAVVLVLSAISPVLGLHSEEFGTETNETNGLEIEWDKEFGGKSDSGVSGKVYEVMAYDKGYVVAGKEGSTMFISKLDENGKRKWEKKFPGLGDVSIGGLVKKSDSGYTILVDTRWTNGEDNVSLIKIDRSRNIVWKKTYSPGGYTWASDLVKTGDGYVFVGHTSKNGQEYIWMVKTNEEGEVIWKKNHMKGEDWASKQIIKTSDSGFAVASTNGSVSNGKAILLKTDSSGEKEWIKEYGSDVRLEIGSSLTETKNGYILAGETHTYGENTIVSGLGKGWVVKTNYKGKEIWNQTYKLGDPEKSYSFEKTIDTENGHLFVGTVDHKASGPPGTGMVDFWAVKTDSSFNVEWQKTYNNSERDILLSADKAKDGYILGGFSDPRDQDVRGWVAKIGNSTQDDENGDGDDGDNGTGNETGNSTVITAIANMNKEDGKVGFGELQKAISYWTTGKTVPGTEKKVDFETLQELIRLWTTGEKV